jgi:hypothetical protein
VIRYEKYGRKVSWNIVKWYGKYGKKVGWNSEKIWKNIKERQVEM